MRHREKKKKEQGNSSKQNNNHNYNHKKISKGDGIARCSGLKHHQNDIDDPPLILDLELDRCYVEYAAYDK